MRYFINTICGLFISSKPNPVIPYLKPTFKMSSDIKVLLAVLFGILAFINLIGNLLTCLVVKRTRSLHVPMYYLLVNLSVANIIMAVFSVVTYLFRFFYSHPRGQAGDFLCKFLTGETIFWIGGFASGFSLAVIAYERYRAVVVSHDMNTRRLNSTRLKIVLTICWTGAILLNVPHFYTTQVRELDGQPISCRENWEGTTEGKVWSLVLVSTTFLSPLAGVTALYSLTVHHLFKGQRQIVDVGQLAVTKVRKKITINLIAITVLFAVCWTLDGVTYIYMQFKSVDSNSLQRIALLREVAILLVCFNSAMHPFLCAFTSQDIRRGLKRTICRNVSILSTRTELQRTSRRVATSQNGTRADTANAWIND